MVELTLVVCYILRWFICLQTIYPPKTPGSDHLIATQLRGHTGHLTYSNGQE